MYTPDNSGVPAGDGGKLRFTVVRLTVFMRSVIVLYVQFRFRENNRARP